MKVALPVILVCLFLIPTSLQAQNSVEKVYGVESETAISDQLSVNTSPTLNKWDYFLYPVPAHDDLNIKVTRGNAIIQQIDIVDERGNQVMEFKDLDIHKLKIDISELPAGKYFMQVRPDMEGPVKMKRFYISN